MRSDGPHGEGSVQRFVDADFSEHYFTLLDEPLHHAQLRRIAAFDLLLNNGDRKGGHLLLDHGRIWGIDHGLSFHAQPKLRTVMWDFAGEVLPDEVRVGLRARGRRRPRGRDGAARGCRMRSAQAEGRCSCPQAPVPVAPRRLPGLSVAPRLARPGRPAE